MRQLRDMKGGAAFDPAVTPVKSMPEYSKLCGWALAQAHAKSGDPALIAGYLGKSDAMDDAVARFAFAYAEQTDRDYDALKQAAKQKRIQVAKTP
jgi:NAD(P)H-dependent flavin oxidoreductase YrpB (nitropropane dioxygenase family)